MSKHKQDSPENREQSLAPGSQALKNRIIDSQLDDPERMLWERWKKANYTRTMPENGGNKDVFSADFISEQEKKDIRDLRANEPVDDTVLEAMNDNPRYAHEYVKVRRPATTSLDYERINTLRNISDSKELQGRMMAAAAATPGIEDDIIAATDLVDVLNDLSHHPGAKKKDIEKAAEITMG